MSDSIFGSCDRPLTPDEVCDIVRSQCPYLEEILCVPSTDGKTLTLMGVNSAGSQKLICTFNVDPGISEERVCELIAEKVPDVITEDDVCELIEAKAVLRDELCSLIAEQCPHVKDVTAVGGNLVITYTENVIDPVIIPLSASTAETVNGITTTTHPDGTTHASCDDPVKSVVDNGDNTWTATTQSGEETVLRDTFASLVDNGDGTGTLTMPDGQIKQIVCAPLPADIRVTGIAVVPTEKADGSTDYSIELTLSDGSTLNGGPVVDTDLFASVVPDNGDGTGTVTDPSGNSLDVCLNPVKSLRENDDGSFTIVNADGTDGTTIPAAATPEVTTTVPNADGSIHTITTGDGVPTEVCTNPFKGFRTNADGSVTLTFQDGTDGPTLADTTIPADGFTAFGTVAADGTVTSPDGSTPVAVYPNGDVVTPGDAVLNVFDGAGQYLGSKKCPVDTSVVIEQEDGTPLPINEETGNQQILCEPGDATGSLRIGGAHFQILPTLDRHDLAIPVNTLMFDDSNSTGDTYDLQTYEFTVDSCSVAKQIRFSGAISATLHGPVGTEQRVILNLERSFDGGAWNVGMASGGQNTWSLSTGDRIVEQEMDVEQWQNLAPGPHTVAFRLVLGGLYPPGTQMAAGTFMNIQKSTLVVDLGPRLVCC